MKFFAVLSALVAAVAASPVEAPVAKPANLTLSNAATILNAAVSVTVWTGKQFTGTKHTIHLEEGNECYALPSAFVNKVQSACVCAPAAGSGVEAYEVLSFGSGVNPTPLQNLGTPYSTRLHDGCYPDFFQYDDAFGGAICIWTHA